MGIVSGLPPAALPQLDTTTSAPPARDLAAVLARHARTLLRADQVWIFVCAREDCSADQLILASAAPDPDARERQARAAASNAVSGRSSRFDRASAPSGETAALPVSLEGRAVGAIVAIWPAADPAALDGDETLAELAELCAPILAARVRPEPRPERSDARGPSGYGAALPEAIKAFDRLPALEDSKARVVAALSLEHPSIGEAVAVIETDPGLTAAVLRAANAEQPAGRKRIASVPAAVDALGSGGLFTLVSRWPTFRPLGGESLPLHSLSTHLNATRLASDAIARAIDFDARHQLRAIALLHDIGKLVLARAWSAYPRRLNGSVASTLSSRT